MRVALGVYVWVVGYVDVARLLMLVILVVAEDVLVNFDGQVVRSGDAFVVVAVFVDVDVGVVVVVVVAVVACCCWCCCC